MKVLLKYVTEGAMVEHTGNHYKVVMKPSWLTGAILKDSAGEYVYRRGNLQVSCKLKDTEMGALMLGDG